MMPHAQLLAAEETEKADREGAAIQSASSPPLSKYEAWQEHWRRQAAMYAGQVSPVSTLPFISEVAHRNTEYRTGAQGLADAGALCVRSRCAEVEVGDIPYLGEVRKVISTSALFAMLCSWKAWRNGCTRLRRSAHGRGAPDQKRSSTWPSWQRTQSGKPCRSCAQRSASGMPLCSKQSACKAVHKHAGHHAEHANVENARGCAQIKAAADAEVRGRMEAALKERLAQDAAER